MSLPSLRLKANADRRLRNGHLWVYSNEIDVAATPLHGFQAGDQAILEAAQRHACDLLFVSSHGRVPGLRGWLHSSVTRQLLQIANLPVHVAMHRVE